MLPVISIFWMPNLFLIFFGLGSLRYRFGIAVRRVRIVMA